MMKKIALAVAFAVGLVVPAQATVYHGTPSSYRTLVAGLQPGDTLELVGGSYSQGLDVYNLNGSSGAWITITGPAFGAPVVFLGDPGQGRNTVEIVDSSFVAIESLTIDGQNIPSVFGVSCKDGLSNISHDIRIEGCRIIHHGGTQETDGISTKSPTWNWTIRRNEIIGAGTGLYLGDSDGSDPFVAGLIENNLVADSTGYCMQIKFQNPRPAVPGMPTGRSVTIIRNNVFIKNDQPSPYGDRPNLLVDPFPSSGPGSTDLYEIYGNFFYHNPRESLLQATGRVAIHDNVFVDGAWAAIYLTDHNGPLKIADVYNNTIYTTARGIWFNNAADIEGIAAGNLIFAPQPITGPVSVQTGNLVDSVANAPDYVAAPGFVLGAMDFYPLPGTCQGSPIDESGFSGQADYDRDFNSDLKGSFTYRGAYAGEGSNPGWRLQRGIKSEAGESTITIISPNGGETWRRGNKANIAWSSTGSVVEVRIELSTNGGTNWKTIRTRTPNDGHETWQVKSNKTSRALLRISSLSDASVWDVSDGVFAIR